MKKFPSILLLNAVLLIFNSAFAQAPLLKQWDKRFGGSTDDIMYAMQQTTDGGYIIGGYSNSFAGGDKTQNPWGFIDYWIVKIDAVGNKQWDKNFGGADSDWLRAMQQTSDGGYILGGYSNSGIGGDKTQDTIGSYDYWIIKLDSLGNMEWDKNFGGTGYDELYALQQTADGGYIFGGYSASGIGGDKTQANQGVYDYWIVKIDSLGNKQWDKDFGGSGMEVLYTLTQTTDKGYLLGGLSTSGISGDKTQNTWGSNDYWIVKIDSLGNKKWDKDFGGTGSDAVTALQQTKDGGYILAGNSNSTIGGNKTKGNWGGIDFWMVKIDSLGAMLWDQNFGGNLNEELYTIIQTYDSGYLLCGDSYSPIGGDKTENDMGYEQTWIVKTDVLGNKEWDKTMFTTGHDEGAHAIQTKDGCYVIANYSNATIGGYKSQDDRDTICLPACTYDYWVIKFCDTTQCVAQASFISNDTTFCSEGGQCIDFFDQSTCSPTGWQWSFPGASPDTSTQQNPKNICYYVPGSYNVKLVVSSSSGVDSLIASPMIIFSSGATLPTLTLSNDTVFSSHASAYQWYFNGLPIAGATDSFYVAKNDGMYNVYITDDNSCSRLGVGILFISVKELIDENGIKIYPNPVSDELRITFNFSLPDDADITIRDVIGKELGRKKIERTNNSDFISTNKLSNGIYMLQIQVNGQTMNKKFVVVHK